jgi:MFS family permease
MDAATEPTKPGSRGSAVIGLLRGNRDFRLLFLASIVSFAGDWFLFVAIAGLVFSLTHSPALTAAVYAANTVPFAVFTFIGGPLADRLNRQYLMITADLMRGALALGFFLIHGRSQVWLVFLLSGAISALGALFEPAASASLPNLVDPEDLGPANVAFGAIWGAMLAVGSAVGGLVVAAFGRDAGYLGDAVSFFVSAALVMQIRRSFAQPREASHEHPGLLEATRETLRYARQDHRVLALLSVKGGFGLGAGVVALLPILALQVFHAGDRGTGILFGFRGVGVVLGPFLVRKLMREDDLRPLFWAIAVSFAMYGLFYAAVPLMPEIWAAGAFVLVAQLGGGAQWTLSTFGLQVIVPDHIRGRVFAFDYGLVTASIAVSATVAGWIANYVGVRVMMVALAGIQLCYSVAWSLATARVRRSLPRSRARAA